MRDSRMRRIVQAGLLGLMVAVLTGCEGRVMVRGFVSARPDALRSEGRPESTLPSAVDLPVQGAQIELVDGRRVIYETVADVDGYFAVGGLIEPDEREYLVRVRAEGYRTASVLLRPGDWLCVFELAPLTPLTSPTGANAVPEPPAKPVPSGQPLPVIVTPAPATPPVAPPGSKPVPPPPPPAREGAVRVLPPPPPPPPPQDELVDVEPEPEPPPADDDLPPADDEIWD